MTTNSKPISKTALLNLPMTYMVAGVAFDKKPDKAEYGAWSDSFTNQQLTPFDLLFTVSAGYAFAPEHDGKRKKENWKSAHYIAVDLENSPKAALDAVEDNPFFASYGLFSYTTYSHTEEAPRSRAVFVTEKPVTSVELWHLAARAVMGMFGEAADPCSADISRAFMGNPSTTARMYGRFLPYDVVLLLASQQERLDKEIAASRQRDRRPMFEQEGAGLAALGKWVDDIARATPGRRNNTLNRAAFLTGRYLVAPGKISHAAAYATLVGAGIAAGLDELEVQKTVSQALTKGATL